MGSQNHWQSLLASYSAQGVWLHAIGFEHFDRHHVRYSPDRIPQAGPAQETDAMGCTSGLCDVVSVSPLLIAVVSLR